MGTKPSTRLKKNLVCFMIGSRRTTSTADMKHRAAAAVNDAAVHSCYQRVVFERRRGAIPTSLQQRLLDADAASDMVARENSEFSVDASVRITLIARDARNWSPSKKSIPGDCGPSTQPL
jgi:hypothetical protein